MMSSVTWSVIARRKRVPSSLGNSLFVEPSLQLEPELNCLLMEILRLVLANVTWNIPRIDVFWCLEKSSPQKVAIKRDVCGMLFECIMDLFDDS